MKDQLVEEEQTTQHVQSQRDVSHSEITVSLLNIVHRIVEGRLVLLLGTLAGVLVGIVLALTSHPWYQAEAIFLPPMTPDMGSASSTAALFMRQDPTDVYLGLLASRSVADDVVDHTGLMNILQAKLRVDARAALGAMSKFTVSKNQLISVQIRTGDPALAAAIANAYLDALYRLNGQMVSSSSSHRQGFFEGQLAEQKEALAHAEMELKVTQEQIGIISPEGEAQAGLSATAQLQAQIGAAETRLAGLRAGATEQNSQVVEARTQLAELQSQLARLQTSSGARQPGRGLASTRELPGLSLEYARKLRDLKLRESVFNELTQQYEKARLATIDPGPQLQIVDRAIAPERKSGPSRRLYVVGGFATGLLLSLGYLLLADPLREASNVYRRHAADRRGA